MQLVIYKCKKYYVSHTCWAVMLDGINHSDVSNMIGSNQLRLNVDHIYSISTRKYQHFTTVVLADKDHPFCQMNVVL